MCVGGVGVVQDGAGVGEGSGQPGGSRELPAAQAAFNSKKGQKMNARLVWDAPVHGVGVCREGG